MPKRGRRGLNPLTTCSEHYDHQTYYPGARKLTIAVTGTAAPVGCSVPRNASALALRGGKKNRRLRVGLFHRMNVEDLNDLDLSYTPPLGSPWDAVQMAAQEWVRSAKTQQISQETAT